MKTDTIVNMNAKFILNRVEHWNLRKITRYLILISLIIGLGALYFWYSRLYMTNERRFWLAIENSMSTPSVVRTLSEGGSGNQATQDFRFHFAPQRVIENNVVFTEKSATVDTSVETEGIIYPGEQYLRYTDFTTRENGVEGSNIDAFLGKWAKQVSTSSEDDDRLNYLSEQVTLAVFGNYNAKFRQSFISELKNRRVYGDNFKAATEELIDDEESFVYVLTLDLPAYAEMLNKAFVAAGYGDFPPLNPDNYQEGSTVSGRFVVRKRDNAFTEISFGGREEKYSNYGVIKTVDMPEATLTIEELQVEVQQLIQ